VSGFSVEWLALREPVDAAARCVSLGGVALAALTRLRAAGPCIDVIDLGAGTGANLRYLAPLIDAEQHWLLVDNDAVLLAAAAAQLQSRLRQFPCRVQTLALDLATQMDRLPLGAGTLVTAAALLDLVSEAWLRSLVQRSAAAGAIVWFALTYDGRIECHPPEPEDPEVRNLVNLHQLTDKGFGAALGPGAATMTQQLLVAHGYHVHSAASDWQVAPENLALQYALVEGWCQAAIAIAPHRALALHGWLLRRRAHIAAARSELRVGHVDIVGHP
jgi:SAM-dependent methyltransferase